MNGLDLCNYTPLHHATKRGHLEAVNFLITKGAKVDDIAVFAAASDGHIEILEVLLKNGGNCNAPALRFAGMDLEQETALWEAAYLGYHDIASLLLRYGADVNLLAPQKIRLHNGFCLTYPSKPFVAACHEGNLSLVKELLSLTPTLPNLIEYGFRLAASHTCDSVVKFLCSHVVSVHPSKDFIEDMLRRAIVAEHHLTTLKYLASAFNADLVSTALDVAAFNYEYAPDIDFEHKPAYNIAQQLIDEGASINIPSGRNVSDIAHDATLHNYPRILLALHDAGFNVDAPEKFGNTLHTAARHNSTASAAVLLSIANRSTINLATDEGETPLLVAADHGHLDMVKLLLEAGALISPDDMQKEPALRRAEEKRFLEIVEAIVEHENSGEKG